MEMESGGDLLLDDVIVPDSIHIVRASVYGRQHLRRIQASEGLLGNLQQFPDQGRGGLHACEPLTRRRAEPDCRKRRLHHIGGAQMSPVVLWELIKGDQLRQSWCKRATAFGASVRYRR